MNSTRKEQRSAGVPEVVKPDTGQPHLLQHRLERALAEVMPVERRARLRGEDEAVIPPQPRDPPALLQLTLTVTVSSDPSPYTSSQQTTVTVDSMVIGPMDSGVAPKLEVHRKRTEVLLMRGVSPWSSQTPS